MPLTSDPGCPSCPPDGLQDALTCSPNGPQPPKTIEKTLFFNVFRFAQSGLQGPTQDHLGSILGPSWGILGPFGAVLGPPWGHLGAILGPLGTILGPPWVHLGGTLWREKAIMKRLGASWGHKGHFGDILGPRKAVLGPFWGNFGAILGPSCGQHGRYQGNLFAASPLLGIFSVAL